MKQSASQNDTYQPSVTMNVTGRIMAPQRCLYPNPWNMLIGRALWQEGIMAANELTLK